MEESLVWNFKRQGDVVMHFCSGTCYTAKECMLPEQQKTSERCDVYSEALTATETDLVLMFFSQVLNAKSDISGSEEVAAAAKVFKDDRAALLENK